MIQLLLNRRNVQQQRFIQTIRVHAALERNTNSAVEDSQNRIKCTEHLDSQESECSVFIHRKRTNARIKV